MIALAIALTVAAAGPALRLASTADGSPLVLALDTRGQIAARITCVTNEWVDGHDAAARLIASTEVAATVQEKNGRLTDLDDLGPGKFNCVLLPPSAP